VRGSGGITFNGDTASANALNDYEEGTWTPQFRGDNSAGTYTYNTRSGQYTKIGELVTVHCQMLNITASSSGAGPTKITGLPYTPSYPSQSRSQVGTVSLDTLGFSNHPYVWAGSTGVYLVENVSGGTRGHIACTDISSGATDMGFTLTYTTDS
jgi:hypothetical protein